jgi:hypothetical protein
MRTYATPAPWPGDFEPLGIDEDACIREDPRLGRAWAWRTILSNDYMFLAEAVGIYARGGALWLYPGPLLSDSEQTQVEELYESGDTPSPSEFFRPRHTRDPQPEPGTHIALVAYVPPGVEGSITDLGRVFRVLEQRGWQWQMHPPTFAEREVMTERGLQGMVTRGLCVASEDSGRSSYKSLYLARGAPNVPDGTVLSEPLPAANVIRVIAEYRSPLEIAEALGMAAGERRWSRRNPPVDSSDEDRFWAGILDRLSFAWNAHYAPGNATVGYAPVSNYTGHRDQDLLALMFPFVHRHPKKVQPMKDEYLVYADLRRLMERIEQDPGVLRFHKVNAAGVAITHKYGCIFPSDNLDLPAVAARVLKPKTTPAATARHVLAGWYGVSEREIRRRLNSKGRK